MSYERYSHRFYHLPNQKRRVKGDYLDMKRMCLKKIPLVSMDEAIAFAYSANNDPDNPDRFVKRMEAYTCPYCQFFHIGRKRPPHRYDEDREAISLLEVGFNQREVSHIMRENIKVRRSGGWTILKMRKKYLRDIFRKAMSLRAKKMMNLGELAESG